MEPTVFVKTNL